MRLNANIRRCASVVALATASIGAIAATPDAATLVWVDNESFGFEACSDTAVGAPAAADRAVATMTALRERAFTEIRTALQTRDVQAQADRLVILTPLRGTLACDGVGDQVTFRVSAIDPRAGPALTIDMPLHAHEAADRAVRIGQADELARHFSSAPTRAAMR
jgi:hypothetical protein